MHGNHQDDNYNKGSKSIAFVAIGKVSQVGADIPPPPPPKFDENLNISALCLVNKLHHRESS